MIRYVPFLVLRAISYDEKLSEVDTGSMGLHGHVLEANLPCGLDLGVLESPQGPPRASGDLTDVGVRRDQRNERS